MSPSFNISCATVAYSTATIGTQFNRRGTGGDQKQVSTYEKQLPYDPSPTHKVSERGALSTEARSIHTHLRQRTTTPGGG